MIGANNTVTIKRATKTPSGKKLVKNTLIENLAAYIEPADGTVQAIYNDQPGVQVYEVCVEYSDVAIGDELVDRDGNKYTVSSVMVCENPELTTHTEIIAKSKYTNQSPDAS